MLPLLLSFLIHLLCASTHVATSSVPSAVTPFPPAVRVTANRLISQWTPRNWQGQQKQSLPLRFCVLPLILKLLSLASSRTTLNLDKGAGRKQELGLGKSKIPNNLELVQFSALLKFWIQRCYVSLFILCQESGFNPFFFLSCQILWNVMSFLAHFLLSQQ